MIIDVMQVLASFNDCLVLVGGWIPELLIEDADEPHVGNYKDGMEAIAESWGKQMSDYPDIAEAAAILEEKFASVEAFGPMQVVAFHDSTDPSIQEQQARRAYELVQRFPLVLHQWMGDSVPSPPAGIPSLLASIEVFPLEYSSHSRDHQSGLASRCR